VLKDERDYYDEFSDWYEDHRHGGYLDLIDDLESDLLRDYVVGKDVLEVGCGSGLILRRVETLADRAVGVDSRPEMLKRAVDRGLDVVRADSRALPFADECFDVVYSFKTLAHVPNVEDALREMVRVARPGGHLLVEFDNPMSLRYVGARLAGGGSPPVDSRGAAQFSRWDPPFEVRRWLPENLELIDFAGVGVLTPAEFVHRIPWIRHWVRRLEFAARDSALKYFGGFLVAIARKRIESGRR